jgi:phage-related holin
VRVLKFAGIALLAVFAPIRAAVVTVLLLALMDMVLGVLAARKRGELITSAGLRRTLTKILVYEVALVSAFLVEAHLTGDALPVTKIVSAYIGVAELKSFWENMDELAGGGLLKALVDRLTSEKQ